MFAFAGIYYSPLSKNDWTLYENFINLYFIKENIKKDIWNV